MKYLDYDVSWLSDHGAIHTAREIAQQPRLWRELATQLKQEAAQPWLQALLAIPGLRIILTGAGTSAFAGKALAPLLRERTGLLIDAIATTDMVSAPQAWLDPRVPTLLVSFARSGNSPESLAAVALADQLLPDCHHLVLTCNPEGDLARYAQGKPRRHCVLMPAGTHDQSFAMTSSFSCMFITAAVMLGGYAWSEAQCRIDAVAALCEEKLQVWPRVAHELAGRGFKRVIYLGSNGLAGLAEEAALKLLELTAGRIATRFDSSLGLRHGPKFMIDAQSCVLVFMSAEAYTRQYDDDVYRELARNDIARQVIALGTHASDTLPVALANADDVWLSLPYLVFAQLFAFEAALAHGLMPDNPCPTGEVNRVVQGVTIYSYPH